MRTIFRHFRLPAIVSSLLVFPFITLEVINQGVDEDFPFPLFGMLWLLPVAFILILTPVLRSLRTRSGVRAAAVAVLPGAVVLMLIGWLWVGIVLDQLPCFLGVPNCD